MNLRMHNLIGGCVSATLMAGCSGTAMPDGDGGGGSISSSSAVIVGSVEMPSASTKAAVAAQTAVCPDLVVTLNGTPTSVEFGDDCSFVITDVVTAASVELRIELPDLGISNTIELEDVEEAELIEILVEATESSLTITVQQRATPESADDIPITVTENNVAISVGAGVYDRDVTVLGNNFTLVGEAGDECDADDWTVIDGNVVINGNNATFRNVNFAGSLEVAGNNAHFINVCFGDEFVVFGNNVKIEE